ncbi:beta-lactamase family protein [Niabella sp. CC-SYL272]|uniref:serine hydrolase domain-containing protein n=1 Tax=Niabella agricola TaxID=2891571 RepID=UPI001F48A698|nr:serine hydrolase domain-containing protein [Niabella agricola]MCF3107889.1 beta-lactamase family protein [Niabella agricola]
MMLVTPASLFLPSTTHMKKKICFLLAFTVINGFVSGQTTKAALFIDSFTKQHSFNGTILLAKKGKASHKKSFGMAHFQMKVPNTPDTRYKIASITKAFTAVLILQLYEQGKIDLNKPIRTYLPGYKGEGADKVTIAQLLNMTSGIWNMDEGVTLESALKSGMPAYQLPHTSDEMLTLFCSGKLKSEPGKVWDYNNANYMILGKVIEQVAGKTFEQQLQTMILQPLEMKHTGIAYQQTMIAGLASTYFYRDDIQTLVNDLPVYTENWYASGAMYATADDLLRFTRALFERKLLKQATLDLMFTPGAGEYGYGVLVYKAYDIHQKHYTIVKRPGSIMGAQTMLFHVLEEDATILILSNASTVSLDEFAAAIAERFID